MVDKTKSIDPGKLTAYERWELPNIGGTAATGRKPSTSVSQKLKPLTAEDIEKIRQQAYDAGHEEGRKAGFDNGHAEGVVSGKEDGFKQGLEQGLEAGQKQISESVSRLELILSELVTPLGKQQSLIEEAMLNVSMAVARSVIHRELSLDSSSIQSAIKLILNDLPKADNGFSLTVNPDDESHVKSILEKYESAVSLKLDPSITLGGCLFNSSSQLIDYTIEKRFQKTVQAMLQEALKNTNDDTDIDIPSSIGALSDYPSKTLSDPDSADPDSSDAQNTDLESADPENIDVDVLASQDSDSLDQNIQNVESVGVDEEHIHSSEDDSQDPVQKNE